MDVDKQGRAEVIRDRLKKAVAVEILDYRDVVYVLIEIAKLIELNNKEDEYEVLMFYRNWVAHPEITYKKHFVKRLASDFDLLFYEPKAVGKVFSFFTLNKLKNEMIRFFYQQVENDYFLARGFLDKFCVLLIEFIKGIPVHINLGGTKYVDIRYNNNGNLKVTNETNELEILYNQSK